MQAIADAERGKVQLVSPGLTDSDQMDSDGNIVLVLESELFDHDPTEDIMEFTINSHSSPPPSFIIPKYNNSHRQDFLEKITQLFHARSKSSGSSSGIGLGSGFSASTGTASSKLGGRLKAFKSVSVPGYIEYLTVDDGLNHPSLEVSLPVNCIVL